MDRVDAAELRPADVEPAEVGALLTVAGRHGDFFALPVGPVEPQLSWHPWSELAPGALAPAVDALAGRMRSTGSPRPIGSLLHLATAARLCSPLLATAATAGVVPELDETLLHYAIDPVGRVRLRLVRAPRGVRADPPALAATIARSLSDRLGTFTAALDPIRLPDPTARGNVVSALAAAGRLLGAAHPGPTRRLLRLLLDESPLRGAGDLAPEESAGFFRRRNCCLFFQLPGGGTCGDCVLRPPQPG